MGINRSVAILFLWGILGAASTFAQSHSTQVLDSLEILLSQEKDDSIQLDLLSYLFHHSYRVDLNRAEQYLDQRDEIFRTHPNPCREAYQHEKRGLISWRRGDLETARDLLLRTIHLQDSLQCPVAWSHPPYLNLGQLYSELGQLETAVEYMSHSLEAAMASDNTMMKFGALTNLGVVYLKLGQIEQAETHYSQALNLLDPVAHARQRASVLLNLGNVQFSRKEYAGARTTYQKALRSAQLLGDTSILASRYLSLGNAEYALGNYGEAELQLKKARTLARQRGQQNYEASANTNLAAVASSKGDPAAAIGYIQEGIRLYEALNLAPNLSTAYASLARFHERLGQFQQAYEAQKRHNELSDSLNQVRFESQLSSQLASFEAVRLKAENDSIQNALTIATQEGEIKDLRLERYWYLLLGLAGILVLLVLLVVLWIRSVRLRTALETAELRHTALRARMNPHFLFNALSSIQNAILNRDKQVAYAYHAKFSELMRMVLMHSEQATISLEEETQALRLYLDLELLRTGEGFAYDIELASDLDLAGLQVPPMLVQPFVENAIFHGLMHRESPGKVTVRMTQQGKHLHIAVDDNGVGRAQAARYRMEGAPDHQSVATRLTGERMALLRRQYGSQVRIQITDKETDGHAAGTLVELFTPLTYST